MSKDEEFLFQNIGEKIKQRRNELGMTQDELAEKVGYKHRSSINKIELDGRSLPSSKVIAFAKALDTTVNYLIGSTNVEFRQVKSIPDHLLLYSKEFSAIKNWDYIRKLKAAVLRSERIRKGISEFDMADILGVPVNEYITFENGVIGSSEGMYEELFKKLGLDSYVRGYVDAFILSINKMDDMQIDKNLINSLKDVF